MTPAAWTLVTLLTVGFLVAAGLYLEATRELRPGDTQREEEEDV